ncbi:MAG: hypothetical protein JXR62_07300 [Bacilli bacterium]|nr:hypothetical protein [Bacilli bacterium]
MKKHETYMLEVLKYVDAPKKIKNRILEDLQDRIMASRDEDPLFDPYTVMGSPKEVASEFNSNLELDRNYYGVVIGLSGSVRSYEYKSKKTLFGIPLVHINSGGKFRNSVAKGIIAVGDISIGVVSIGGLSFGIVSMGGVGLGLLSIAGIAVGLLSIGGISLGLVSIGGIAIGMLKAIGALKYIL